MVVNWYKHFATCRCLHCQGVSSTWSVVMERLQVVWSMRNDTTWSGAKWSEVKWRCLVQCVYYHWFIITQFACGLLYSALSHCVVYLPHCFVYMNHLLYVFQLFAMFNYSFYDCVILCRFCPLLCAFCVFVLFCILFLLTSNVVSYLFVYKCTDHCHLVETQLQLINIYISYITKM